MIVCLCQWQFIVGVAADVAVVCAADNSFYIPYYSFTINAFDARDAAGRPNRSRFNFEFNFWHYFFFSFFFLLLFPAAVAVATHANIYDYVVR